MAQSIPLHLIRVIGRLVLPAELPLRDLVHSDARLPHQPTIRSLPTGIAASERIQAVSDHGAQARATMYCLRLDQH